MAKIKFKKGDDFMVKLDTLSANLRDKVIGAGIYDGAGLLVGSVREELRVLPTDEGFGTPGTPTIGPKKIQKAGLDASLGISKMETDRRGFTNVSVGFHDYNRVRTKAWPQGQPNQMVARAVEKGTSFMLPNPFVKRGVAKCKKAVISAMKARCQKEIDKIVK